MKSRFVSGKSIIISALMLLLIVPAHAQFGKFLKQAGETVKEVTKTDGSGGLSQDQIIKGLKEALAVGSKNAGASASKLDGFNKNQKIRIPFPPEVNQVKSAVEKVGLKPQVDKFVETLNRAAEEAAKEAAPIFVNAIISMNISDGLNILNGADNAATQFLQKGTTPQLKAKFEPIVKKAIDKVQLTKYWNPIINQYNRVPFVKKVNPDLEAYVLEKAIAGMFVLVAEEEAKIRKDPAARVSDILKTVFGK
ncbi:MAG: DUF4197 domain-containing protein [Flavobacteriales bacterium]|nr:DUF4197 domain-containing protein [Flavobacteriales bacterium]